MEKDSFADALGSRHRATDPDGSAVEVFRLCPEASAAATTEAALTARANRLAAFVHPGFASIRRVERVPGAANEIRIVTAAVPGIRLSELLRRGAERGVRPSAGAVRNLARQVLHAMADFHRAFPDLAHGTLGPERIVIDPEGRAVIVEHLLAPALEPLRMGRTALWNAFRIPVPSAAGAVRFDQVSDVVQLGMLTLALTLGRPIGGEEYPHETERMLAEAATPAGGAHPIGTPAMRAWLVRSFQVQLRTSFRNSVEAAVAFEEVFDDEPRVKSRPSAVLAYIEAVEPGSTRTAPAPTGGPGPARTPGGTASGRGTSVSVPAGQGASWRPSPAKFEGPAASQESTPSQAQSGKGRSAWSSIRRRVGIAAGSLGLVAILGVVYFGPRAHAHWPIRHDGHRVLATETHPAAVPAAARHAKPLKSPASAGQAALPPSRHPL